MTGRIAVATGVTVALLVFIIASAREDVDLGVSVMAAVISGIIASGLVLVWGWAL